MFWDICPQHLFSAKKEELISKKYMEQQAVTIMYTARTIYPSIRSFLPSLLLAHGDGLRLPDDIISSEYITLEGRKISTSQNWAVWAKDIAKEYNPDAIRYFFIANGPEKKRYGFLLERVQKAKQFRVGRRVGKLCKPYTRFCCKISQ